MDLALKVQGMFTYKITDIPDLFSNINITKMERFLMNKT